MAPDPAAPGTLRALRGYPRKLSQPPLFTAAEAD